MKYTITKISIDKEAAIILITEMAAAVREKDATELDKRQKEFVFTSDDELIDVCLKIQFNSDYQRADGGIKCVERGVTASVKMYNSESGEEVEYESPIALEEEIEKIFWI